MTPRRVTPFRSTHLQSDHKFQVPDSVLPGDCMVWTGSDALPRLWAMLPASIVLQAAPDGCLAAWSIPESASSASEESLAAGSAPPVWEVVAGSDAAGTTWQPAALARGNRPPSSESERSLRALLAAIGPTSRERMALEAGIRLLRDDLDGSHQCSQQLEGLMRDNTGDYWHAIMHRREPDSSNSKYWFRHVGRHPIFADLSRETQLVLASLSRDDRSRLELIDTPDWNPHAFVDACSQAGQAPASVRRALEEIQFREMCLLLNHSWKLLSAA